MGVDLSINIGVGLVVPETDPAWEAWRETVDPRGNYGGEELLDFLTVPEWVRFGTGGSYYDNKPLTHWFSVKNLTQSHYGDKAPGGVFPLPLSKIMLQERLGLLDIAKQIGLAEPVITPFVSYLWH